MNTLAILGSTGSIGTQTLDIVKRLPERLRVGALFAGSDAQEVASQAMAFGVNKVGLFHTDEEGVFDSVLPSNVAKYFGASGLEEIATLPEIDTVVVAVAGAVGIRATIAALLAGKTVALATKEVLVAAGEVVVEAASLGGGTLIPIDSEHSAIFQCLVGQETSSIKKLWLTASGGPFRGWNKDQIENATLKQALNHPTWNMGPKVTIDSATLMNKGLETIEARWLFDLDITQIDVVVHAQSVIHSMVELVDGAVLAQLGVPDMRLPIAYALTYPDRVNLGNDLATLDVTKLSNFTFEAPDIENFPCLRIARNASKRGGTAPAVMNAANEAAVDLFLKEHIKFVDIPAIIESALDQNESSFIPKPSLDQILLSDQWAREYVTELTINATMSNRTIQRAALGY